MPRLCPEAVFLPVDYREYVRISEVIKSILREVSPNMEDVGIDEAFLDISAIGRLPEQIAREIKERIREATGLTCSIGIAPNKLLAKIASDMEKPDGITIITEKEVTTRIWPLPVRKLWGVGPKTEEHLKGMGVETVGDLASLPRETLTSRFGLSYGNYLFEAARGIDNTPLATFWEPKSMSRETTFQHDVGNRQALFKVLAELAGEVAAVLKREGYQGKTVRSQYSDFETHTHAKTLPSVTYREEEIRRAAFSCFCRFELKKKVRLIGVRVSGLDR
jgi:DNA polymerase-4